ncbi:MAG: hypothetical protein AAF514_16430 [Verrucomicrobiota bacterium]
MEAIDKWVELVTGLCRRPEMYTCEGSYNEICAFLQGYTTADRRAFPGRKGWAYFQEFVCARFGFPSNYGWPFVIRACAKDEEEAIEQIEKLLVEFCDQSRTRPFEEMVATAALLHRTNHDGGPERTLRAFLDALLEGKRSGIEPFITAHPRAAILWRGPYPVEVRQGLKEASAANPIARISGDENEGRVELFAAEFPFPISVRNIEGTWRVDPDRLIEVLERGAR